MNASENLHLEELFNQALDLAGDERTQFLANLSQRDAKSHQALLKMIEDFESMDDLFENPLMPEGLLGNFSSEAEKVYERTMKTMATESPTMSPDERLGRDFEEADPTMIGPYKVLRKIGEGGMGLVYMVEQSEPRRHLALKILTRHRTTMELRARFEAEYRVMAMMTHPNIAALHDTGTTEHGDIYFTMEYVEGMPITQYCKQKRLTLRQRLVLFRQVCEGVIHAHQKAVLHRDLKPSNILVTEQNDVPIVKIIDFGISKMTEQPLEGDTFETRVGTLMGTLEYMSHEQLVGKDEMDTRSDVFSLGVLLYELLTGLLPLKRKGANVSTEEVLRYYRETEAPAPSSRLRKMKNLKDHLLHSGYDDGSGVLPSLSGDLDWVILKAMAKDTAQRFQTVSEFKQDLDLFLDEKPVAARPPSMIYMLKKFVKRNGALVASASMILAAMIAGLVISIRANFRVSIAKMETEKMLRQYEATNKFLSNMLSAPDPKKAGANAKVVDVLMGAEEQIQALDPATEGHEEIEAFIRTTLGNTFYGLGKYNEAKNNLQRSYELKWQTLGSEDPKTLRTRFFLGKALRRLRQWEESEGHFLATLEAQERILGVNHLHTLETKSALATLNRSMGKYSVASELYSAVISALQDQTDGESLREMGKNLNGLAGVWKFLGNLDNANRDYQRAFAIQIDLLGEEHPETISTMTNYADSLRMQRSFVKARELYQRVYDIRRRLFGLDHNLTIRVGLSLGEIFLETEENEKAVEIAIAALELPADKSELFHVKSRSLRLAALGLTEQGYLELGKDLAEDLYHFSLEEKAPYYFQINSAALWGHTLQKNQEYQESLEPLSMAWAIHSMHESLEHPNTSSYALLIGKAYLSLEDLENTETWVCLAESTASTESQFWAAQYCMAELCWLRGERSRCMRLLEECVASAGSGLSLRAQAFLDRLNSEK